MIQRLKSMYRAGRTGQPMPARSDKSVGEAIGGAALTVAIVGGVFFAMGAGSAAAERVFSSREAREVKAAKKTLELEDLNLRIEETRRNRERARKDAEKSE